MLRVWPTSGGIKFNLQLCKQFLLISWRFFMEFSIKKWLWLLDKKLLVLGCSRRFTQLERKRSEEVNWFRGFKGLEKADLLFAEWSCLAGFKIVNNWMRFQLIRESLGICRSVDLLWNILVVGTDSCVKVGFKWMFLKLYFSIIGCSFNKFPDIGYLSP